MANMANKQLWCHACQSMVDPRPSGRKGTFETQNDCPLCGGPLALSQTKPVRRFEYAGTPPPPEDEENRFYE